MLDLQGVRLDAVLSMMPLNEIVDRLSGRRTCSKCKAVFHVTARPPHKEGVCDQCGGQLIQREDDRPESIRVRMQAYEDSTRPLVDYYQKTGRLLSISAAGTPEAILERSLDALQAGGVLPGQPDPRPEATPLFRLILTVPLGRRDSQAPSSSRRTRCAALKGIDPRYLASQS